jgi:hypothetical protein
MILDVILFYGAAIVALASGLFVISQRSPVNSAFSLIDHVFAGRDVRDAGVGLHRRSPGGGLRRFIMVLFRSSS